MKVVINACYGGFGLSDAAYKRLIELGIPVRAYTPAEDDCEDFVIYDRTLDETPDPYGCRGRYWDSWSRDDGSRADPRVVQVVEELGKKASDDLARLIVVEIPDGVDYTIEEYDGFEHVAEKHRTWP